MNEETGIWEGQWKQTHFSVKTMGPRFPMEAIDRNSGIPSYVVMQSTVYPSFHQTHHLIKGMLYSSRLSPCPLNAWGSETLYQQKKMRPDWGPVANRVGIGAHLICCVDDISAIEYKPEYKPVDCAEQYIA